MVADGSRMESPDIAKNVRDGYDAIAQQYMELVTAPRVSDPRSAWINEFLGRLSDGSHVLDLGCGPGVPTAAAFVRNGHRVTGIDISPRQVELARVNVPPGRFLIGEALTTNFPSGSFDAIAALFVLTHLPRDQWAWLFARFVEWLSPQGWLLATFGMNDSSGWDEEDFLGFGHTNWTNGYGPDTSRRLFVDAGGPGQMCNAVAHEDWRGRASQSDEPGHRRRTGW